MTEQQKDFVHMYLKHRDKIIAHNIVYGDTGNYDAAESAANRLLRIPEIAETIRSIQDNIRYEVEEEFKAKYREELMSIYEKRLLLKKIATGEMYVEQKYKGKNCTQCSQYISPTINQMLAALKEDSKLAGHYPHKAGGKWIIPAGQVEEKIKTEPESQENSTDSFSRPFRGLGGELAQDNTPEKDNNGQQVSLSPAGGGVSLPADGGGTLAKDPPEKDPSELMFIPARTTVQSGRRVGNNGQYPDSYRDETTLDNQPLAVNTSPLGVGGKHYTPTTISQEKLRELLYHGNPKTLTLAYGNKLKV